MINVGEGMLVFFPTQESRKASTFDGELLQINRVCFSSLKRGCGLGEFNRGIVIF